MAGGGVRRPDRAAAGEPAHFWLLRLRRSLANSFCFSFSFSLFADGLMCRFGRWELTSLQLDFDGGAPPEQAWRRRLNSHANILKEFSVTFMEAMRMVWTHHGFGPLCWVFYTTCAFCSSSSKLLVLPAKFCSRNFR